MNRGNRVRSAFIVAQTHPTGAVWGYLMDENYSPTEEEDANLMRDGHN